MSTQSCVARTTLTYVDQDGNTKVSAVSVAVPYSALVEGTLDVPDLTAGATAFAVPFGTIAKASLAWVENLTGQSMTVKVNGSLALYDLPTGSAQLIAAASLPAGTALTALSLTTTGGQVGAGYIAFRVMGD